MKLDKKAVERLLTLNDEQLRRIIEQLGSEAGLDLSSFQISTSDMERLRTTLAGATDQDLVRAAKQLEDVKKAKRMQGGNME